MNNYRQGDILFRPVSEIPKGGRKVTDGVIARGEQTGHCHRICELEDANVIEVDGRCYVGVISEHGVSIVHDEHKTLVLPRQDYEVVHQREYTPTEIRNVQD